MGIPQQGSIEGPQRQPSNLDGKAQNSNDASDVNGSIQSANSAAESFLSSVGAAEVELEAQNIQLQSQIAGYELTVNILSRQITDLKAELANKLDCDEDDKLEFRTDAELAGETSQGSGSSGSFAHNRTS